MVKFEGKEEDKNAQVQTEAEAAPPGPTEPVVSEFVAEEPEEPSNEAAEEKELEEEAKG